MRYSTLMCLFLLVTLLGCGQFQEPVAEVVHVTTENFEAEVLRSEIPVLLDFTATWCVPCKVVDPIIESLPQEMAGRAKIAKLDIDESPEVYERLRVNGVPTVMFFNDGVEQDRITSPQKRETYVQYLETMIAGGSALDATVIFLDDDFFRRHYLVTRSAEDFEAMMAKYPGLLSDPFENGQTPLSLILLNSSPSQNARIEVALRHDPDLSVGDLAGLGRCDELKAAIAADPEAANRPDPDGATPLWVALMRAFRLGDSSCLQTLLDGGANPSVESEDFRYGRPLILQKDAELMQEFLNRGWDPTTSNEQGFNALHWATIYGPVENVRVLLDYGVDPGVRTVDGKTAVELVQGKRDRRAAALEESDDEEVRQEIAETIAELDEMLALLEGV